MTPTQFDALAQLLRLRAGPQQAAARLVLVDGLAPADAARQAGVSLSALGNTLRACKRGLTLARLACGPRVEGAAQVTALRACTAP